MPPKKRELSNSDNNPPPAKRRAPTKASSSDAQASLALTRSIRTNFGKGGAAARLEQAGKDVRPDLQKITTDKSKKLKSIPSNAARNNMAPSVPKPRSKKKAVNTSTSTDHELPLQDSPPEPSHHRVAAGDGKFGFKPAVFPPEQVSPGQQHPNNGAPVPAANLLRAPAVSQAVEAAPIQRPRPRPIYGKSAQITHETTANPEKQDDLVIDTINQEDELIESHDGDVNPQHAFDEDESSDPEDDPNYQDNESSSNDNDSQLDIEPDPIDLDDMNFYTEDFEITDPGNVENIQADGNPQDALFFDEDSPDEDERRATAILRNTPREVQTGNDLDNENVPLSVLEAHYKKNGPARAPDQRALHRVKSSHLLEGGKRYHKRTASTHTQNTKSNDEGQDTSTESSNQSTSQTRAPRNSKVQKEGPKPTQLGFYEPPWTDVLSNAKDDYDIYIHTQNGFPEDSDSASDCLLGSIQKYNEDTRNIEPLDESYFNIQAMTTLVFDEGAATRGALKTLCRAALAAYYGNLVTPTCENQLEYIETVKRNVTKLLKEGFFLRGGVDDLNRTRNFGNPLIADICRKFYYNAKNTCLSRVCPEAFEKLPRECLALVCACIQNCLHEYETGFFIGRKFEGKVYSKVYLAMLKLIDEVDNHPYHGPRLDQTLRDIAVTGRMQSRKENISPDELDLAVVLD